MQAQISYYSGFADEAGFGLETQIRATREIGWRNIEMRNVEVPGFPAANLHDISDEAFAVLADTLQSAEVSVNCFGTAIGKNARGPFDYDVQATRNIAARAERVGAKLARLMSYPPNSLPEEELFRRLRELTAILLDAGVQPVFENCGNFAGMSGSHAVRLVENVPGAKLVFDPGNCVSDLDYSKPEPYPRQDAWEFYQTVRPHIAYFHVKDAIWDAENKQKQHTFPGEGEADVRRILTDLLDSAYQGALSIEPHMHAGLPDETLSREENCFRTYVEYGRRLEKLVGELTAEGQ